MLICTICKFIDDLRRTQGRMSDGVDVDAALEAEVLIYKRAAHENLACEEFVDTPEDIEEDHWIYELLR